MLQLLASAALFLLATVALDLKSIKARHGGEWLIDIIIMVLSALGGMLFWGWLNSG